MSSPIVIPVCPLRNVIHAGITPLVISSSGTSDMEAQPRPGNMGVPRKSLGGHSLITNATRAIGNAMAGEMKSIAKASREIERSKINVQLKMFSKQMEYN